MKQYKSLGFVLRLLPEISKNFVTGDGKPRNYSTEYVYDSREKAEIYRQNYMRPSLFKIVEIFEEVLSDSHEGISKMQLEKGKIYRSKQYLDRINIQVLIDKINDNYIVKYQSNTETTGTWYLLEVSKAYLETGDIYEENLYSKFKTDQRVWIGVYTSNPPHYVPRHFARVCPHTGLPQVFKDGATSFSNKNKPFRTCHTCLTEEEYAALEVKQRDTP